MSFNDQVQNLRKTGNRFSVFKEGVKTKWLTGNNGILFRILPAYNYQDTDGAGNINPAGWLPCRDANGNLTSWGIILRISRYIGHGTGKTGNRKDFMSPVTFTNDEKTFDPVAVLYQTAAMYPEWQYLVQDRREGGEKGKLLDRAALSRASEFLALNIVELGGVNMSECVLGLCTKSTTDCLVNREKGGLVYQRANNMPAEMIRQNPMLQWSLGDITDPVSGPVFYVMKGNDRGEFSGYQAGVALDNQQQIRHYPVGPELLAMRYDLTQPEVIADMPDPERTIQELIEIFNVRSPTMHHEHELLKLAFGDVYKIPDPPAAPGMSNSVPGFGQGQFQGAGFGPPPGRANPDLCAQLRQADLIVYAPGSLARPAGPAGPVGPAPAMQHAAANARAAAPAPAEEGEDTYDPALDAAPAAPPPPPAPPMSAARGPAGATPPAAPSGPGPVAPGDPVPGFNREGFLGRLQAGRRSG